MTVSKYDKMSLSKLALLENSSRHVRVGQGGGRYFHNEKIWRFGGTSVLNTSQTTNSLFKSVLSRASSTTTAAISRKRRDSAFLHSEELKSKCFFRQHLHQKHVSALLKDAAFILQNNALWAGGGRLSLLQQKQEYGLVKTALAAIPALLSQYEMLVQRLVATQTPAAVLSDNFKWFQSSLPQSSSNKQSDKKSSSKDDQGKQEDKSPPPGSSSTPDSSDRSSSSTTGSDPSSNIGGSGDSSSSSSSSGNNNSNKNGDEDKMSALLVKAFLWMLTAYMFVALVSLVFPGTNQPEIVRYVSWNEFVHHMLAKGEVEEIIVRPDVDIVTIILHDGAVVKGRKVEHKTYHMNIVDMSKFESKLREAEERLGIRPEYRVPVVYERNSDTAGKLLASIIVVAIILALITRSKNFKVSINMDSITQMGKARYTLVEPMTSKGVKFSDVAGLKEAKQEVMEFVDYLKRPERYKILGAKVPRGALLLGPPGCGKTMLAKAVATEANVPFLSMNGSEFIEMIGGLGAARVRDLFKEAKKRAPCIIYIDEIDAIGRKRSGAGGQADGAAGEGEQTLNQLLVEMDGMASKEGVLVLSSTNRADVLDKALLRPGRFDRHILIDLPTYEERKEIFEHHLKGIKMEFPPQNYSKRMAQLTPGFSGADIANVCNEAALHGALYKQKVVTGADLEYAVERVVGGTEKRTQVMSPDERRTVAYHEAGHALVGWMLKSTDALLKVTIVPRTNQILGFASYMPKDQKLYNREELFERMCMALGGRVAESLTFNRVTTGAQNDLEKVTKMAYAQIRQYGMNERIGLISFGEEETGHGSKKPFSKKLAAIMDEEARRLVTAAYKKTEQVLLENKDNLEKMAKELLKRETLNYEDIEAILGPPPHGQKNLIGPEEFELNVNEQAGVPKSTPPAESPQEEESKRASVQ